MWWLLFTDSTNGEATSSIDKMRNDVFDECFDEYSDQSEGFDSFLVFQKCRLYFSGGDIEQSSAGCSSSDAEFELALVAIDFLSLFIYFSAGDFDFDEDG